MPETLQEASDALSDLLKRYQDSPILFLTSGGSCFNLLPNITPTKNMTIGILDERYSEDPSINNFEQLMATNFYDRAFESGCRFIDSRIKEESQDAIAKRLEDSLRSWVGDNPTGEIIVTMGLGPDGHTSGIMPYPENPNFFRLFEGEKWTVGYDAGSKNQYPLRVTTTLTFLREINHAVAYISGEEKTDALRRVLAEEGSLAETPGRIFKELKDVQLFTDIKL